MSGLTSPDTANISVGTGFIEFKPTGSSTFVHVGNVPSFKFGIKTDTLDHFVPVDGIRVRDYSWTIEQQAEVEIEMEEITAQNLQLILLGDVTTTGGVTHVSIQARNGKSGSLKYTATNETGPRWHILLTSITFNDGGDYAPIGGGDFNKISVKAAVMAVNGVYGEMTLL